MFADDLLLYKVINSPDDYNIIITPNDVNTLAKWVDNNHMTLNLMQANLNALLFLELIYLYDHQLIVIHFISHFPPIHHLFMEFPYLLL